MNSEIGCSIMCRACMKVDSVLLPMYGDDMISKKNLPDKLADLASIRIDKYDGLPTVLCAKCAYRTDAFYDFKLQVQATEKKLRKMFQSPNTQNLSVKAEVTNGDWENDEYLLPNSQPSSMELNSEKDASVKCPNNFHEEKVNKIEENDVKPVLEENEICRSLSTVETNRRFIEPETIHLCDDSAVENGELEGLQNLGHIFIPNMRTVNNQDHDELQNVKDEVPDEIKNILQSQHLSYTLLYIPAENVDNLQSEDNRQILNFDDSSSVTLKNDREKVYDSVCNVNMILEENSEDKECSSEPVSLSADDSRIDEESGEEKIRWETTLPYGIIKIVEKNQEPKPKEETNPKNTDIKLTESVTTNNNEDSDSDYFVDPKDNLLGSLNDTIMRIKEIKIEGRTLHYQCTLCMQNYDKLTGVLIHTVDNHVPSSGPFFCVVCEKDCASHRDLRSHVKTHSGRFPYTCFICNKAYSMKRYLKRHMSCHTDFPRHRCPKCGDRFNVKTELETHIRTHVHGGAPFACSQCPRLFNHKGNYKRHLISHLDPHGLHLPKFPCEVCGKRFLNNRTLETHKRVHTGEKPFKCDICNRSFSQQGNLLNHMRIHSNPRSYTCEVCGKRFNQRATLRDHSLLHTGEKPYVCTVCGVAFTFSAALRRHMWTHSNAKPFGCEICNARFVGKYDIKRHMKIHTDRPRTRRRRNQSRNDEISQEDSRDDNPASTQVSGMTQTIFIEQGLLTQDATQIVPREESEKENVDALFNLIQYG